MRRVSASASATRSINVLNQSSIIIPTAISINHAYFILYFCNAHVRIITRTLAHPLHEPLLTRRQSASECSNYSFTSQKHGIQTQKDNERKQHGVANYTHHQNINLCHVGSQANSRNIQETASGWRTR